MAQDFHAAFGLGSDRRKLAPGDLAGVGLAAIKELQRENEELRQRVDKQNKRLKALED